LLRDLHNYCALSLTPSNPTDEEQDNQQVAGALVDALAEANALELLVERLSKMNEAVDEEAAAVNHGLAVIEHAVEVRPKAAAACTRVVCFYRRSRMPHTTASLHCNAVLALKLRANLFACLCPIRLCHALQLRPSLAEAVLERTKLLKWLLTRIRVKASDSNKQYASEILSILMQVREQAHIQIDAVAFLHHCRCYVCIGL
jgi:hypothetical protein